VWAYQRRGARWPRGKCNRRAIAEPEQCSQRSVIGWVNKICYLELLRASEGTISRWSRLHLQLSVLSNPHWARVVGSSPFSLCVIHKESLCPSSGDVNRLMMIRRRFQITQIQRTNVMRRENMNVEGRGQPKKTQIDCVRYEWDECEWKNDDW
jgi:hypothetical protein